jgi:hypothetical protein
MIWEPLGRFDNGQLNGGAAVIGRNKGVGLYPIGSDHVVNENILATMTTADH